MLSACSAVRHARPNHPAGEGQYEFGSGFARLGNLVAGAGALHKL